MLKLFSHLGKVVWFLPLVIALLAIQAMADLYMPNLTAEIITNVVTGNVFSITKIGVHMLSLTFGIAVCGVLSSLISSLIGVTLATNTRKLVFTKISGFSLQEFDKFGAASLITRTTNDITQIQTVVVMMFRFLVYSPILCIGGIVLAAEKNLELTWIMLAAVVLLFVLVGFALTFVLPKFKLLQQKIDGLNLVLRENLKGIRVIRAFGKTEVEYKRFENANDQLTKLAIKVNKLMACVFPLAMFVMNITLVAIMWYGGVRVETGVVQIGDITAFIQYATQIMFSIIMFSIMLVMIPRAQASASRVNEVLNMDTEIKDPERSETLSHENYDIVFDNVTFSYAGAEEPILQNISFIAKHGQVTAIIGGTGSGKSTIINLIPRFYDVTEGRILIGGTDIRNISQQELRSKIGLSPQTSVLFSGTISDNIKFGKQDASDVEISRAIEISEADEFVQSMQQKYDAKVAQSGSNLSGGQKQRLSIARSVARRPKIYIFDDSFAALDARTETKLRQQLLQEVKDAVVIMVSQKISTVMHADNIVVVEDGKIAGIGTHEQLIETCSVYQETVMSQTDVKDVTQ